MIRKLLFHMFFLGSLFGSLGEAVEQAKNEEVPIVSNSWETFISSLSDRPSMPEPGYDSFYLRGEPPSVEEFFREYRKDSECREQLIKDKTKFKESKNAVRALAKELKKKKENQETILPSETDFLNQSIEEHFKLKGEYFQIFRKCGDCAYRIVPFPVKNAGISRNWYISDGSCLSPWGQSPENLKHEFDARRKALLTPADYSTHTGGFSNILFFSLIDTMTGQILQNIEKITDSPYYAQIGVRGPRVGNIHTAATYFFEANWKDGELDGSPDFWLSFRENPKKSPLGFKPKIRESHLNGETPEVMTITLYQVQGSWYLNSKGYFRYYTAADFGMGYNFVKKDAEKSAEDIMTETLIEMLDFGNAEY